MSAGAATGAGAEPEATLPEEAFGAALAGLDQRELITIPSLPDAGDWERFNSARKAMQPNLSRNRAADRYRNGAN